MSGALAIPDELLNYLTQSYQLPAIEAVTAVTAGFLSVNYVLHTQQARYFLKQYRFTRGQRVAGIHEAKFFFANAQIPVILPQRNQAGDTFFAFAEKYYSLFPYIAGRHLPRGCFSAQALTSTATLLAQMHRRGQHANPSPYIPISQIRQNHEQVVEQAQQILNVIPRHGRTAFDELAEACLRLKLHLVEQHKTTFAHLTLASDHLIHGDYQDANLFFDAQEQVSHLFDWEKAQIAPRSLELVRALEFICLSNPDDYRAVFSEENYTKAQHFLHCYQDIYPLTRQEFACAAQVRYLHKVLGLWVETEHYLARNERVDPFLAAEYHALQYYAQHLAEHVERLTSDILG